MPKEIREVLKPLELSEYLEIIEKVGVSLTEIFDFFQDARYQNHIVGFHYGGHADSFRLLKEIILKAFPYPMSLGLRILFANTPEMTSFSEIRLRQLLKTYWQSHYFIFTVLLSELWEIQQKNYF